MQNRSPVLSWFAIEYQHWDALSIPAMIAGILVATMTPSIGISGGCLIAALIIAFTPHLRTFRPIAGLLFFFACGLLSMSYRQSTLNTPLL